MLSSACFRAFADLRMSEKKYTLNISAHLVELNKQLLLMNMCPLSLLKASSVPNCKSAKWY